jgi:hypothetical protein
VLAIAVDPDSGDVAFGDERGASRARAGEPPRLVARTAPVGDLAFDRSGALWIATLDGLWRQAEGEAVADRSPAPGEAARRIRRVATSSDAVAVASDAGVFATLDRTSWARADGAAPSGEAAAVALRCLAPSRCELWWLAGAAVWRAELERAGAATRVVGLRQETLSGAPAGVAPLDLLVGAAVADVVVLYPQALAFRAWDGADAGSTARGDWTVWRPVMPPGAVARRIVAALGRLWLATDRGLLHAEDPRLGWQRAGSPAGWTATAAVAGGAGRIFSATESGVLRGQLGRSPPSRSGPAPVARREPGPSPLARPPAASPPEPRVQVVHSLALAHLGLDPVRQRMLRKRASRRSWWPELDLSFDYGGDRSKRRDYDQSFLSGDTRNLLDRDRDRGDDWGAAASLSWDLASAVFDPEIIDLAREERAWIALRDDVLDEINLLYYERRRVLLDLRAQPDARSLEAERLRLRAGELAAGLDAWTGGGFTRALATAHSDPQLE